MTQQKLTIETTLMLDGNPITVPSIIRDIYVDFACPTKVTVKANAPGCKMCFRVEAGLKELLKFLLLQPKLVLDPDKDKDVKETEVLEKGFSFYTSDPSGHTGEIKLSDTQVFTDSQIELLFGDKQKELEKITFVNHTRYPVEVKIIQGRDLTPCDEDDAACALPCSSCRKVVSTFVDHEQNARFLSH